MPAADRWEREAKFRVEPDQQPLTVMQTLLQDGYTFQSLGTINLTDTYLDTPAFALLRHGLALRVRFGIAAYEVGIKSLEGARNGASQTRLDIAFALPINATPLDATTWPAEIFAQLADVVADMVVVKPKALRPLVVVRQTREKSHFHPTISETASETTGDTTNSEPQVPWVAEWSLDEVWIGAAEDGGDGPGDAPVVAHAHFHELEIELLPPHGEGASAPDTTADAFDHFVDNMQAQFNLTPLYTSKFMRGLESTMAETHGGATALTPTMTLADAGRLLLHQQLLQILLNEQGVRQGKRARYVHDMRVALRRARAAIHLCQEALEPATIAPLGKGLKQLGRSLGAVRDLDVALANLRDFTRSQPEDERKGLKRLRAGLKTQRGHARAELLALLDSKKYRKFIADFARFCASPSHEPENATGAATVELSRTQVRHTVPSLIWAAFEAVRAYEIAFESNAVPPLETFHALRIQTKYLRYLIEFTQHLLGSDGERLAQQLGALQEHLGKLNDAHVEDLRLLAWDEELPAENELRRAIASRRAQLAAHIDQLLGSVPFTTLVGPRNRNKFARSLARI